MDPLFSRRQFILAGSGLAVLAACGSKSKVIKVDPNASSGATALNLVVSTYIHSAGIDQRVAVAFIQGTAPVTPKGPVDIVFRDQSGKESPSQRGEPHLDGPDEKAVAAGGNPPGLPYFIVYHRFDNPGIYTAEATYNGKRMTTPMQVTSLGASGVPGRGQLMISAPSPTVADGRGVSPICTRQPVCPLHDVSLDAALAEKKPLALLFATPLLCQSRLCGPTLENLLGLRDEFAGRVRFMHSEIYTDTSGKHLAPLVEAYHLESEPFLFLAKADGTVFDRLDNAVDQAEMRAALNRLSA